jgi:hypothetical protein
MLTKCSSASCVAPFRYLGDGRLFRLETDPALGSSESNRMEYFWLCHACSSTVTLRLTGAGTVVTVLRPEPIRGVSDSVALSSTYRGKGLLLCSVSPPLPEPLGGRTKTRLKLGLHAA